MMKFVKKRFGVLICAFLFCCSGHAIAESERIIINNGPWQLVADWQDAKASKKRGIVLLLHKAAGNRSAYSDMADILSRRGYASLRVDLRGHGESINVRAFDPEISRYENPNDPAIKANFELIQQGYLDIATVVRWLREHKELGEGSFAVIGSSYTGEEMVKATDSIGFADAYIALAPGNFSANSIEKIDPSGKPWLFVRAKIELPFFDGIFQAIKDGSKAEIWVLPGEGHATDLFDHNKNLEERLIDWLDQKVYKK